MSTYPLLLAKVEVSSAHINEMTHVLLVFFALVAAFFLIRPEIWARMMFTRVDPRPAGLLRIAFGSIVLWTFLDLIAYARFLFTDEGLFLTSLARKNYGGVLNFAWDPDHGFENFPRMVESLADRGSIFHLNSDPAFVYSMFALMVVSLALMIVGKWTRVTTLLSWLLVESLYRYSPVFFSGGDTVVRVFLFLGVFADWGQAYSLDSWRWRKKAVLAGAREIPPPRRIAPWPMRLMMLQLAIIYCATGILKSGDTWMRGTALYYALNLDHFYRIPSTGLITALQRTGILPLNTWIVHWWEVLFPLALVGAAVNGYERMRAAGRWTHAALWRRALSWLCVAAAWAVLAYALGMGAFYYIPGRLLGGLEQELIRWLGTGVVAALLPIAVLVYRALRSKAGKAYRFVVHWVLGKRWWLTFGFLMHIGIDVSMNVGTFAEVMIAVYPAWLCGAEVEAFWIWLFGRTAAPGQHGRPVRRGIARLLSPIDGVFHRRPGPPVWVHHAIDDDSVRRVALLRMWDLGGRLRFVADDTLARGQLHVRAEDRRAWHRGDTAGAELTRYFPGLWWLWPFAQLPPLRAAVGRWVLRKIALTPA